jgi:hypothetical protein
VIDHKDPSSRLVVEPTPCAVSGVSVSVAFPTTYNPIMVGNIDYIIYFNIQ